MSDIITIRDENNGFTQANELIRATRGMGDLSHKLYFFFLAKREKGQQRFETTVSEVRKALGLPKSGQQNALIVETVKELEKNTIVSVKLPIYRSPRYQEFIDLGFFENEYIIQSQPILKATIGTDSKNIVFDINSLFIPLLDDLDRCYSWAYLENIARLKGKYSYRVYEWIESKIGNNNSVKFRWYLDNDKDNEGMGLRQFLGIPNNQYKNTNNLKRRVIEPAFQEIKEKLKFDISWKYVTKIDTDVIQAVDVVVARKDSLEHMYKVYEECCLIKPSLGESRFQEHYDWYTASGLLPEQKSFEDFLLE